MTWLLTLIRYKTILRSHSHTFVVHIENQNQSTINEIRSESMARQLYQHPKTRHVKVSATPDPRKLTLSKDLQSQRGSSSQNYLEYLSPD